LWEGADLLVCDLEKNRLTRIKAAGDALGWWDDPNILLRDAASDLVLFNVVNCAEIEFHLPLP
jgi:hypothetical protein